MTNVEEYGDRNIVNIEPSTANMMKKLAMNIVIYMVILPKNSNCIPAINIISPINTQLSLNTFHKLDT